MSQLKTKTKPNERVPRDVLLPRGWHARENNGIPYRVKDGDRWDTVAEKFDVDVKYLIWFNFFTTVPEEVNWYLRNYVGCNVPSPSGRNWAFSRSARPGIIYIPPPEHDPIDMDGEEICVWTPGDADQFLRRLATISNALTGHPGTRIKKLVQVMVRAGYPAARNLWYYNPGAINEYVSFHTGNKRRREMTETTKGAYPFRGYSGVAGEWQIFPGVMLFDEFACRFDVDSARQRLQWIDREMYNGWYAMTLVDAQSSQGGGSGFGELVPPFINHVRLLSKDNTHLYSAFG